MNAPQLRFKDGVGRDFPDWSTNTLEEVSTKHYQGINTAADTVDYVDDGFPIIQAKHITNEYLDFSDARKLSPADYEKYKNKYNPKINDLLISNIGTLGKVVLIEENIDFLIAWNIFKVTLNPDKCNPIFIKEFVKKIAFDGYFDSIKTGNATKFINKTDMLAIEIDTPSISEQTKIANFLTAVDEKISQLTQKCELLTQYKKGVMQQIFSQALRFKDDGKSFPKWRKKSLGEIAGFIKDGTHGTHPDTEDGEYYLLSAKNIQNGKIYCDHSDRKISKHEFDSIYKNYKLKDGDILLSVVGTIGRVALFSSAFSNVAFQRSVAFFRFDNEYSQFMAQLFSASKFQNSLLVNQVVSAQPGIYLGDLSKIEIDIPSFDEQTKIANYLTAIDDKIANAQAQLAAAKQYKQGLLQQMFV